MADTALAAPTTQYFTNIAPFLTNTYDNGTTTNEWFHIYSQNASTSALTISGTPNCNSTTALTTNASGVVSCGSVSSGNSGTVSTSTHEVAGFLPYWTSNSGTPALLGQVATGTISGANVLSVSAGGSVVGSAVTVSITGGTAGQTLAWLNGIPTWAATTTAGTGLTYSSGQFSITAPVSIALGGTNATSFTTSGNGVYYDGTRLVTAPPTSAVTYPYATTTALSATTLCLTGDICRTTWPSSGTSFGKAWELGLNQYSISSLIPTTTVPIFIQSTATSSFQGGVSAPIFNATSTTASSTFANGLDLSNGCFSVIGTCLQTIIQAATAFKSAANYAATTTLAGTPTYANGTAGVGATLTEVGFGALYVDGNSPVIGNRILVKNQADQTTNGVYTVTVTGSAIASYVLTRSTDFNTSNDIYAGVTVPVLSGTANAGDSFVQTTTGVIVLGTSNIVFAEASAAGGGVSSFAQTYGTAQTGAITIASSTAAIANDWGMTNVNGIFTFNFPSANSTTRGLVTSGDWSTFNNKISSTSLSGASVISYTAATGIITTAPGTFGGATAYNFPQILALASTTPFGFLSVNPTAGAASNAFVVGSSTATDFLINNSGNVGIATTSPTSQFSIQDIAGLDPFAIGSSTASLFGITQNGQPTLFGMQPATTTTLVLDWSKTSRQVEYQIGTAATSITFINATTSRFWTSTKLVWVCNPGASAGAVTWAGVEWVGTAPVQTTTANQCDVYNFNITRATSTSAYKVAGSAGTGFQ